MTYRFICNEIHKNVKRLVLVIHEHQVNCSKGQKMQ